MARSVKDLRELISVSRLSMSMRVSDTESEEDEADIEDRENVYDNPGSVSFEEAQILSGSSSGRTSSSGSTEVHKRTDIIVGRPNSAIGSRAALPDFRGYKLHQHDHVYVTSSSSSKVGSALVPESGRNHMARMEFLEDPLNNHEESAVHKYSPKHEHKRKDKSNPVINHDLPKKYSPIPPIGSSREGSVCSTASGSSGVRSPNTGDKEEQTTDETEIVLQYIDVSVIGNWLERCNEQLDSITQWLTAEFNFVQIAKFLLVELHKTKRKQLLEMEYSILIDELKIAFKVGIETRKVKYIHISRLLQTVFHEYPKKLLGRNSTVFLLNTLCTFCAGKNNAYKRLLSNVKYSTTNKQIIQWLLAIRAFSLINLCAGVIMFHKQLNNLPFSEDQRGQSEPCKIFGKWLFHAIEKGYVEVFKYICKYQGDRLNVSSVLDEHKRNLIFYAALQNQEEILHYLITQVCILHKDKMNLLVVIFIQSSWLTKKKLI